MHTQMKTLHKNNMKRINKYVQRIDANTKNEKKISLSTIYIYAELSSMSRAEHERRREFTKQMKQKYFAHAWRSWG